MSYPEPGSRETRVVNLDTRPVSEQPPGHDRREDLPTDTLDHLTSPPRFWALEFNWLTNCAGVVAPQKKTKLCEREKIDSWKGSHQKDAARALDSRKLVEYTIRRSLFRSLGRRVLRRVAPYAPGRRLAAGAEAAEAPRTSP